MRSSRLRPVLFWAGCFVVPIVMLCVVAAVRGVYPFGGQSFLTEDLKYQYVDFFTWFRRVLAGEESVFYSTACGLGANTWGLYSYYLASPFNLLLLLFDQDHLTLFAFVVDALKLGCIQLAATFYLSRRFGLVRGHATVLALGYTWGLWSATNLRNPMWMDALILLPLLMWAVWLLVRSRRWVPLALLMAADVICCWYTAYMTVLFIILWTILEWWCAGRSDEAGAPVPLWRLAARFARPMLVALALSAWTFVPTVLSMAEAGGVEETSFLGIIRSILGAGSLQDAIRCLFTTNPPYLLRGLVPALYDRAHAIPQLYCGVLLMGGYVAFFASRGVPAREARPCRPHGHHVRKHRALPAAGCLVRFPRTHGLLLARLRLRGADHDVGRRLGRARPAGRTRQRWGRNPRFSPCGRGAACGGGPHAWRLPCVADGLCGLHPGPA